MIEWLPTASVETANIAFPPASAEKPNTSLRLERHRAGGHSRVAGVTVAVNVTDWPNVLGFFDDETAAVEVAALFTVCTIAADVLGL